jgi:RHS repeat-associated protein
VLDNGGALKDTVQYDAFGNIISETGSSFRGRYAWTGRDRDAETGYQYNRARWYNPSTARWLTQDPLGFDAGDSNLYRYISNGVTLGIDASGMSACVTGVTITAKGLSGYEDPIQLGNTLSDTRFAFAFKVKVTAAVTGGDDIAKVHMKQEIFQLLYIQKNSDEWVYLLTDLGHPGKNSVTPAVANAAHKAFLKGTFTYDTEANERDFFDLIPELATKGNDWLQWLDAPGFPNIPGTKSKALVAEDNKLAYQYLAIKVTATGTDGKSMSDSFWALQCAVSMTPEDSKAIGRPRATWRLRYRQSRGMPFEVFPR